MSFTPHIFEDGKTVITAEIMKAIEAELVALRKEMGLASYPVGSIYMSVRNVDPATLFGGKWAAWGSGRVPVGVDTTQSEFNYVEKPGGNKALQSHTHSTPNHTHSISVVTKSLTGSMYNLASQTKGTSYRASGICAVRTSNEAHGYGSGTTSTKKDGYNINASHNHSLNQTASGGGTSGTTGSGNTQNLQPYITCYMFKRIE